MSYCVNCGVELDDSAKKCPLCSTPVINPNLIKSSEEEKPFPDNVHIPKGTKKRFIVFAVTAAMFIPAVVTFFLNVFFIRKGFWSFYVLATLILLWTAFVMPFILKNKNPYVLWGIDTIISAVYCFFIIILHSEKTWVVYSVLLLIALVSVSALVFIMWFRHKKRHWTAVIVMFFSLVTAVSILSGFVFTAFSELINYLVIGTVCGICSLVLTLFFVYCNKSKHVRAWLNKAFYI